jgi:thiol:disulfide interchange protein DsbG
MAIAHAIGLRGTPTLVWRKPDGTEGRIDGVPTSIDALLASMGS